MIKIGEFLAKCTQQEIDNLNGTLYIDHYGSTKRRLIDDKIKKVIKKLGLRGSVWVNPESEQV